jgi:hypothetical protein
MERDRRVPSFDPHHLSALATFCRATDLSPALAEAWFTTWPRGPSPDDAIRVGLRHDSRTQFTSTDDRQVPDARGV